MSDLVIRNKRRSQILELQEAMEKYPGVHRGDSELCPLKHSFADGIYVREIFIPAGTLIVGKIHKHKHPNFLLSGTVDIVTEFGTETLVGPLSIISEAGTKRALHAKTDLVWVTVHANPTNTQDLSKLEDYIIAPSYEEYEKLEAKKSNKIILFFNKLLRRIL